MRHRGWVGCLLMMALLVIPGNEGWAQSIDPEAIEDADEGIVIVPLRRLDVVQNKSFTKEGRLELSLNGYGLVVNNQFANRQLILSGASVGYHLREQFYAEIGAQYFPYSDNNIKPLTIALLEINANTSSPVVVTVPAENLYASASIGFSPIYGKVNLLGEHVQNFDVSFLTGAGVLMIDNHDYQIGSRDENGVAIPEEVEGSPTKDPHLAGHLAITTRFPVNSWLTLKLEGRLVGYFKTVPDYDAQPISANEYPEKTAFDNSFIVTFGGSFFLPRGN